jgi:tetratricopeptide (TPR) repeat protein
LTLIFFYFLFLKQGKPEESVELFENALAVLREAYTASKESKASGMRLSTGLNNYAYWMKMEGQYNEALVMYQESFEMRERHAGKDDVSTIISLQNMAELLTSMESDDEANIVRKEIMERVERLKQD